MAKTRVHELAKQLGVDSKTVLADLKEMGEFVRGAASTIELPVERKLKEKYAALAPVVVEEPPAPVVEEPVAVAPAKKTTKKSEPEPPQVEEPVEPPVVEVELPVEPEVPVEETPEEKSDIPKPSSMIPRPMPRPTPSAGVRRPGAPRPGNNPYASSQGMGVRRPQRDEGIRGPGQGTGVGRPGGPGFSRNAGGSTRPSGPSSGAPTSGRPTRGRGSSPFGAPTQGPGMPMGRGGRGGRTGSGTQGAFGRQGGPARKNKKSKKLRRQEFDEMEAPTISGVRIRPGEGQTIRLPRGSSLTDFAEKISVDPAQLVQLLFNMGEMLTATQSVSDDTLEILGSELNYDIQVVSPEDEDRELLQTFDLGFGENLADDEDLVVRSPIVTIMGHVDHGKTKLLDAFRRTNIVEGEAGGITQAIGAYQVATEVDGEHRSVTFIDTPGHEAFTAMRVRGAQVTDIAVLVVAADDGVMPQTVEALNHAVAADVPVVVAVNKIDKEGADPSKVRGQLSEYGLVPDTYGGDTMFIDVSAVTGDGLDDLLTGIVLTADAALDLRVDPHMPAQGVAIEAHLDRGRGPVATTIVQRGTLNIGDSIVVGNSYGRVRALINDHGVAVDEAEPSTPVQILGLTAVPGAGDNVLVVDDERTARQIAEKREARMRAAALSKATKRRTLEDLFKEMEKGEELNLILKGDSAGSVEALEDALVNIDVGDEVTLRIIDRGVGAITETNVALAAASNAIIIGFHVRAQGHATQVANQEGVDIRYYSIIYQAIDDVEAALKGMLKPIFEEQERGVAEIRETFKYSKAGMIAGCMVMSGTIRRHAKARLVRDGIVVAETSINTLRREKDDVVEVREGYECGMTLTGFSDIRIGDSIETYEMVEKPRD
ncbi:MAG: translation initiation factor IF-2 [Propionibacteriaceae bacterium]|nr:translation initiation factor IF-2 [Propionibacteriaceae bacterium]